MGDGRFHFGHRACPGGVNVCCDAVDAVHDEGARVHAFLGPGDEVEVGGAAGPGRVDVGVWVEDGFEVFPFAGVAGEWG